MDFVEAKHIAAREIALSFGVPPMLLGIPGDNTYSNYAEANRAFYRQTVVPLVTRIAVALGHWLGESFGGNLRLAPDLDEVPALSIEREALWKRVGEASFLTDDEKRAATGYEPLPASSLTTLLAKYSPDQPRVPAGNPDGGQWTSGGEGGEAVGEEEEDDSNLILVAEDDTQRRYSVDLEEEDKRGGHGHKDHVGKTDEYLLDVLEKDWIRYSNVQHEITVFRPAEGSFESSLQANDLVNQTLRLHKDTVDLVASGQLDGATLNHRFGYQTGKEAFRPNGDAEPYIRPTYGVIVVIRRDPRSERGYRVHTAYPTNRTSK